MWVHLLALSLLNSYLIFYLMLLLLGLSLLMEAIWFVIRKLWGYSGIARVILFYQMLVFFLYTALT